MPYPTFKSLSFCLCSLLFLLSLATEADTFIDNFSSTSYSNNDGTNNWAGSWQESDSAGCNQCANNGDVEITGGQLHLQDANNSISRSVDLSSYTSAILSFDYNVVISWTDERFDLEIRTNGASWTVLQSFPGAINTSDFFSIDISNYLSANTEIRFIAYGPMENEDDLYIDNLTIDASTGGGGTCTNGLEGTYYDQNGTQRAYFTGSTVVRTDSQVNFNWGRGSPATDIGNDDFSIRWEGYVVPDTSGSYTFSTRSDDGIRLYIDGNLIINQWNDHAPRNHYAPPINLVAGTQYLVTMEFYERGGEAVAELYWSGPGISRQFIPNSNLFTPACGSTTPPDPIAEWRFEDPSWNGTPGEVLDQTGNGYDGRELASSSPETTNPAIPSSSGTCGYGDFNSGSLEFTGLPVDTTAGAKTTVTFWMYWDGTNNVMPMGWYRHDLWFISGSFGFNTGNSDIYGISSSGLSNGWHHVAAVFTNGDVGSNKLYIDGVEQTLTQRLSSYRNQYAYVNSTLRAGGWGINTGYRWRGLLDEMRIYDGELSTVHINTIMNETHDCGSTLDHYSISFTGSGSTCTPKAITIAAEDSSNNTITDHTGTVSISTSTSHGNWSIDTASGTLTPNPDNDDNGAVDYEFVSADLGDIILDLSNSHAESLTITVADGTISNTSAALTFSENAFVINQVDSLGDDIVAGRNHDFQAQMVRRDPVSGDCGVATEYNVSAVKAWISRHSDDPNGTAPALITASETQTMPSAEPGSANLTLPFVSGEAFFSLATSDVGKYAINFKDDAFTFSDTDIATVIPGDSPTYIVRPFGFHIEAVGNPAASSSGGTVYTVAGNNFTVNVSAVGWESGDDSNDDGSPDNHSDTNPGNNASLAGNSVLPSFGQESSPQTVTLSSLLDQPSGGNDPGLSGATLLNNFSGGISSNNNVNFTEVGIIEIAAAITSGNYMGAGTTRTAKALSKSGYVGRFKPSHFTLSNASITPACAAGNFTYMQQPFAGSYDLTARNSLGITTQNYTGSFARLDTSNGSSDYYAIDQTTNTALSSRLTVSNETYSWSNGVGSLSIEFTLGRDGVQDGPYSQTAIGSQVVDEDGVAFQSTDLDLDGDNSGSNESVELGSNNIRYGRLRLDGSHGPESAALQINFVTEYWDGSRFRINTADSCTEIPLGNIIYPNGPLSSGDFDVSVGGGTSTGNYGIISASEVGFAIGDANHFFSAPGVGNTGQFDVDVHISSQPWLQFDWDNNGTYSDNTSLPTATFSFGSYRGNDRLIYWREVLN